MRTFVNRLQAFLGSKGVLLLLTLLSMGSVIVYAENATDLQTAQPEMSQAAYLPAFIAGVKAYREGDYLSAYKALAPLHAQHPENSKVTYYLAITEAQLGRFSQAKKLYEEILTLDPNSDAAKLASEGLKFLPAESTLDLPPRFQQSAAKPATPSPVDGQSTATTQVRQATPSISPQDWMAMQMMMGQNGMSGTGGMNAMPWMMPGGMTGANGSSSGSGAFDPSLMSTMMMNQMMQNMTLGGSNPDENR